MQNFVNFIKKIAVGKQEYDVRILHQGYTHNHFTALLEYVWYHPGEQIPKR